jgi:hypothetical protein
MAKLGTLKLKTKAEQGATMIVRDPFGEPTDDGEQPALLAADGTPATLTLLGADSETARKFEYRLQAEATNRAHAVIWNSGKRRSVAVTPEEKAEEAARRIDKMVALTVGWHGFEDDEDQPIPFSEEAVRCLYEQNLFIYQQAEAFVNDRARFFARSSTDSASSSSTTSA